MTQSKRHSGDTRRTPRQQRSRQAVDAIFEATARLVESQGVERLTTARIAELSGYGVGTLYDYFPDKYAILVAMARRELDTIVKSVQQALTQPDTTKENTSATQKAMHALVCGFGGRQRLRGALLTTMIASGHASELSAPIELIVNFLRHQDQEPGAKEMNRLSSDQLYILTRAVVGIIRAWAMEGCTRLSPHTLEVELTHLVQNYVHHAACAADQST
ncbi:TetR/AcrR family transcriptional regulator [Desulfosarcina sp. OttesenSCG-928-G17]|nr:TetR/AcrR family transcriptional regulator [Desulfosarcina sp. OttesenSCG-928-G17]